MTFLAIGLFAMSGLYRPRLHLSLLDEIPKLSGQLLIATALISTVVAIRHERIAIDGFLRASAVLTLAVIIGRGFSTWATRTVRSCGWARRRTVLIGAGELGVDLARLLFRHKQYGLEAIGYVDTSDRSLASGVDLPRLGDLEDLRGVLKKHNASSIIIADPILSDGRLTNLLRDALHAADSIFIVPRLHLFQTQASLPDHIGAVPIMRIRPPILAGWQRALKRIIDISFSMVALVLLAPVFVLCAIAVRLESGRGVIFRQERVGLDGRLFSILKFRSLKPSNQTESETKWSVANDHRLGPVGRLLRRTSLDEIPQLYNVLRGDMTLVGPRPERPYFVERFSSEYREYAWRHRVPAGLTGLAQVSGLRGDTPIADRTRFDNYYIENWSLWLDLKIVLRTLREVIWAGGR